MYSRISKFAWLKDLFPNSYEFTLIRNVKNGIVNIEINVVEKRTLAAIS